jgi:hypothetical protein
MLIQMKFQQELYNQQVLLYNQLQHQPHQRQVAAKRKTS